MQGLSNYKAELSLGIYCYCVTTALPLFVLCYTISFPIPVMPCTKGQEMNVGVEEEDTGQEGDTGFQNIGGTLMRDGPVGKIQLLSLRFGV